jgi:hypothetical protein
MNNQNQIYQKALQNMRNEFTGHNFTGLLRHWGISETIVTSKSRVTFLEKNCDRLSRLTWRKKNIILQSDLEAAIKLVKSHGLKVTRETIQIEEL